MMDAGPNVYTPDTKKEILAKLARDKQCVICISSTSTHAIVDIRNLCIELQQHDIPNPRIIITDNNDPTLDQALVHYAVEAGSLLLEGWLQGLCLGFQFGNIPATKEDLHHQIKTLNSVSFGILQATRTRISKTEYISCPSCGRTLFDLQETTAKIRAVTNHLKGVKIAIMGCIVNGPGEMADADFGYVGSGVGKITLYKNKEVVKRNIDSEVAVDELINLLKEHGAWVEP
jgi:(E)-4-hydroxy-3-methylbut-2-enyl-diphosphate synthase